MACPAATTQDASSPLNVLQGCEAVGYNVMFLALSILYFCTTSRQTTVVKWGRLWLFKDILMSLGRQSGAELGRDKVVQNSAGARQGTTPTQLTLSSKGSASCVVAARLGKRLDDQYSELASPNLVTTRHSSNKFGFALAAPRFPNL